MIDKKIILFIANAGKYNKQKGWSYAQKVVEHYTDNKNKWQPIGRLVCQLTNAIKFMMLNKFIN